MWHLTKMVQELYQRSMNNKESLVAFDDPYKGKVRFRIKLVYEGEFKETNLEFNIDWYKLGNKELPKKLSAGVVDFVVENYPERVNTYWIKPIGIVKPK